MYEIIFIIIAVVIIILISVIVVTILIITTQNTTKTVGDFCVSTKDCDLGLSCENQICLIPHGGSCSNDSKMCVAGSHCINDECKSIASALSPNLFPTPLPITTPPSNPPPLQTYTPPRQIYIPPVQNTPVQNTPVQNTPVLQNTPVRQQIPVQQTPPPSKYLDNINCSPFNNLYIGTIPNDPNATKFLSDSMTDCFFYKGMIFVVYTNEPSTIYIYSLNGILVCECKCNIAIYNNIEVVGDEVFVICNGFLYKAKIPNIIQGSQGGVFIFINQNESLHYITGTPYCNKLYKKRLYTDPYALLGPKDDYITIDHNIITYNLNGQACAMNHNNKYPFYYENKIYLNDYRCKGYHKDSIFLCMK